VNGWHDFKKGDFPKESKLYLVWLNDKRGQMVDPLRIAQYDANNNAWRVLIYDRGISQLGDTVTHWHDLPEFPPK